MLCQNFTKRNKVQSTFSVHQKLKPKHTSSMFPWIMKRHCVSSLACNLMVWYYLPNSRSRQWIPNSFWEQVWNVVFEISQQRIIWFSWLRFMQLNPPPFLRWRCWGVLPFCTSALWLYGGFWRKKRGEAQDSLPQITHQSWWLPLKWDGGVAWLHHLAEARIKTPVPLGAALTDKKILSQTNFRRKACFTSI